MKRLKPGILAPSIAVMSIVGGSARAQTAVLVSPTQAPAVAVPTAPRTLDMAGRTAIIAKVGAILDEYYVYPEVGEKMKAHLAKQLAAGAYDAATSGQQFANLLTRDLVGVSHDRHLGIFYRPEGNVGPGEAEMTPAEHDRQNAEMKRFWDARNGGVVKAEILPGNIGYLEIRGFGHPEWAGESVASAMAFVSKSDALIIDVRNNGGGYPQTVALMASYLLSRPSIHGGTEEIPLFLQNDRKAGTTTEIRTWPYVPGQKYLDRDVYLLTSRHTFSGAELFADALKTNKRATLVGETTAGASRSMLTRPIDAYFEMSVSFGWTKNAVTGVDWDGSGITPDVAVPAQTALETARLTALKKRAAAATDPGEKGYLAGCVAEAERALAAVQPKGPLEGNTTFRLKGHKDAKAVYLAGDFNHFDPTNRAMVRDGDGWIVRIDLTPGKYDYKFVVDGDWILDPSNPEQETDRTGFPASIRKIAR